MAEIVEVRRHSLRGEGKSLSADGVALAQRAAEGLLGNYQACYTSPKTRGIETLEAFGLPEHTAVPEFGTLPANLESYAAHVKALHDRTGCTLLEAYLAIPATHLALEAFGQAFFGKVLEIGESLHPRHNALIVSHGGSIEAAVLAAMPDWSLKDLGGELAECEAALFVFRSKVFMKVDFIRL